MREATFVLSGEIVAVELNGTVRTEQVLKAGDMVVYDPRSYHTMENRTEQEARTLTFKYLGETKDAQLFASDKLPYPPAGQVGPAPAAGTMPMDPRYAAYVTLYSDLDKLIWQIPGFLVGVTALAFGLFGTALSDKKAALPPFSHNGTVGLVLLLLALLYGLGVYAMWRLRVHHSLMGDELAELEPAGYFRRRKSIVHAWWPPSAPHLFMFTFAILGLGALIAGILLMAR